MSIDNYIPIDAPNCTEMGHKYFDRMLSLINGIGQEMANGAVFTREQIYSRVADDPMMQSYRAGTTGSVYEDPDFYDQAFTFTLNLILRRRSEISGVMMNEIAAVGDESEPRFVHRDHLSTEDMRTARWIVARERAPRA
ncbi:hypothetical protein ACLF3G_29070 [Falsiroseomonas sp. HC035]|uniref:hypothetical protein n=1 Tax=Falsiroseomonas sp. HC035 TaxID=3390999 RepID=UPI003D310697